MAIFYTFFCLCSENCSKFESCGISLNNRSILVSQKLALSAKYQHCQQKIAVSAKDRPGIKRFQCDICSYSCDSRGNMEKHKRVHTKEKPFTCSICSKCFSQKGNLKIHMHTHIGQCHLCGIKFDSESALKSHIDCDHK